MIEMTTPRETVLVTCRAPAKILGKQVVKDNIITLNWHMPVSFKPALCAISVGKSRFSLRLIRESKVFAMNLIPYRLKDAAVSCGSVSGEHIDKFEKAQLAKIECAHIDCPALKDAVAYLECQVTQEIEAGDHVIFVAKVLHSEQLSHEKRLFHIGGDLFTQL